MKNLKSSYSRNSYRAADSRVNVFLSRSLPNNLRLAVACDADSAYPSDSSPTKRILGAPLLPTITPHTGQFAAKFPHHFGDIAFEPARHEWRTASLRGPVGEAERWPASRYRAGRELSPGSALASTLAGFPIPRRRFNSLLRQLHCEKRDTALPESIKRLVENNRWRYQNLNTDSHHHNGPQHRRMKGDEV